MDNTLFGECTHIAAPCNGATEDDFENDRGCKDMLKVVKYKELFDNLGDDRSTLHKYARARRARAFASR